MRFQLTKPAILAAVAYIIMAFVILIPLDNRRCDALNDPTCFNFGKRILTLLLMLIPILFIVAIVMSADNRAATQVQSDTALYVAL